MENLLSNIRLPWLIFTLLVFTVLVKLGMWQNNRAIEKEERLNNIVQLSKSQAMSLPEVLKLPLESINDFPIQLNGTFEKEVVFLLDNQTNQGQLGYRVYQVFNVNEQYVLVNLGWIVGSINRAEIPDITAIEGSFELNGHIRLIDNAMLLMEQKFENVSWPLRVQQVEIDKFSVITQKPLLPFIVYVNKDEILGYKKNWQPIVMPPEKHRAYAFQWFSLAIAWIVLMWWASVKFGKSHTKISDSSNN